MLVYRKKKNPVVFYTFIKGWQTQPTTRLLRSIRDRFLISEQRPLSLALDVWGRRWRRSKRVREADWGRERERVRRSSARLAPCSEWGVKQVRNAESGLARLHSLPPPHLFIWCVNAQPGLARESDERVTREHRCHPVSSFLITASLLCPPVH